MQYLLGATTSSISSYLRRGPNGFYIVLARREAVRFIEGCIVEDIGGGVVAVKTTSRAKIVKVVRSLMRRNLLIQT